MSTTARNHSPFVYCVMQWAYQSLYDGTLYINSMFRGKQCQHFLAREWYNALDDNWAIRLKFPVITNYSTPWSDELYELNFDIRESTVTDNQKDITFYIREWEETTHLITSVNAIETTYNGQPGREEYYGRTYRVYAFKDGHIVMLDVDGYEINIYSTPSIQSDMMVHVIEKSVDGTKPNMQYDLGWSTGSSFASTNIMMIPENKVIRNYYDICVLNKKNDDLVSECAWCVGKPINLSYFYVIGEFSREAKDLRDTIEDITSRSEFVPSNGTVFDEIGDYTVAVTSYDLEGASYNTSFTYNVIYTIDGLNVAYDNSESGLNADNLQDAITECQGIFQHIMNIWRRPKTPR